MEKLNIRFGGFNYSDHYYNLLNKIAHHYGYDDIRELPNKIFDKINWVKEEEKYIKRLAASLSEYFQIPLKYKREYQVYTRNVYTDTLTVTVPYLGVVALRYKLENILSKDQDKFNEFVKDLTTPRNGYLPYWKFSEVMNDNALFVEFALHYLLQHTGFFNRLNV